MLGRAFLRFCNTAIESASADKDVAAVRQVQLKNHQVRAVARGERAGVKELKRNGGPPEPWAPWPLVIGCQSDEWVKDGQRKESRTTTTCFCCSPSLTGSGQNFFVPQVATLKNIFSEIDRNNLHKLSFEAFKGTGADWIYS